ncbi:MAG TPA: STAS domain-containing protein [Vicinamibacteria bacterium]|nr:STAS domain-containing protein [Vicinamibacteria bacterium]
MKIEERHEGDVVMLDLSGKLMIGDGDDILREKVESLVQSGHKRIGLNLADVPYVDSAGLGEIVRCYTSVSRNEGKLRVVNPSKRIMELLTVTRLKATLVAEDDEWKT